MDKLRIGVVGARHKDIWIELRYENAWKARARTEFQDAQGTAFLLRCGGVPVEVEVLDVVHDVERG